MGTSAAVSDLETPLGESRQCPDGNVGSSVAVTERQSNTKSRGSEKQPTAFHRIKDGVQRMAEQHNVVSDPKLWTTVEALVDLFGTVNPDMSDPPMVMFRSALGRVFSRPLRKAPGLLGLSSPSLPVVNVALQRQTQKNITGEEKRRAADVDKETARLREERMLKRKERERLGITAGIESSTGATASFRYMDEFLGLSSASDMIDAGLFPNAKELAESMSAYNAVRDYLLLRLDSEASTRAYQENGVLRVDDPSATVVVVGDGHTPRTAGLFAFRTNWRCVSIDPVLRTSKNRPWRNIMRLDERPSRVQDVVVDISDPSARVVVIAWHAHVSVKEALACLSFNGRRWDVNDEVQSSQLRQRVGLVTCACCQFEPQQRCMPEGSGPDVEYEDLSVPSGRRTVRVWRFRVPSSSAPGFSENT